MNKLIYSSYSPNTRAKDLLQSLLILLQPWLCCKEDGASIIEAFENKFGAGKAFTFNLARSGMFILYDSLHLPEGSEVLVQGFTCSAAINPLLWAGLRPVYVDISPDTLNMDIRDLEANITPKTKAIQFQFTFGNSSGLKEVSAICKKHNLLLIEDRTNIIFGPPLLGDAAIFSFGRDKAISGVNGGLIYIKNTRLLHNFDNEYQTLSLPPIGWTFKELIYPILWATIKATFVCKVGKLLHVIYTKLGLLSRASVEEERMLNRPLHIPATLPASLAKLATTQLGDINELNNHRILINEYYAENLKNSSKVQQLNYDQNDVLLRFPILVEDADKLVKYLQTMNIYVGDWYRAPIVPLEVPLQELHYHDHDCPTSEKLCKQIINLPNHINLSLKDAEKIVTCISTFYEN